MAMQASAMADAPSTRGSRAFRRAGGGLVGPEGLLGDAAPAQPGAARLSSATQIDQHWGGDERACRPLAGKRAPMSAAAPACSPSRWRGWARQVTGDRRGAGEYRGGARSCRRARGWRSTIASASVEALDGPFDLVTSLEVVEHVADTRAFVAGPGRRAGAGRAADPLDAQPHRAVAADDDRCRRRARPDPARHARLGQVPHARGALRACSRMRAWR